MFRDSPVPKIGQNFRGVRKYKKHSKACKINSTKSLFSMKYASHPNHGVSYYFPVVGSFRIFKISKKVEKSRKLNTNLGHSCCGRLNSH